MQTKEQKTTVPLYLDVSLRISAMIENGELRNGDRLPPERELAERFNVSRTSVREAIRLLSRSGMLASRRGSGTYVRADTLSASGAGLHLSPEMYSLNDLLEFREMLECRVAELAARRASEEEINGLKSVMYDQQRAIDTGLDETSSIKHFHLELAKVTRNPLLVASMSFLNAMLELRRVESGRQSSLRRRQSRLGHHRIITALEQRSEEAARDAMLEHLHNNTGEGVTG